MGRAKSGELHPCRGLRLASHTPYICRMAVTSPTRPTSGRVFRRDIFQAAARELGAVTVEAQAALVGLSRPHLSNLLNGVMKPSFDTADHISDVLGIPVDEFFPRVKS